MTNKKAVTPKTKLDKAHTQNIQDVVSQMVVAKPVVPLVQQWALENVQTREVANRLNQLSLSGKTIFSVHQSQHIGGSYEVIYYSLIEKPTA